MSSSSANDNTARNNSQQGRSSSTHMMLDRFARPGFSPKPSMQNRKTNDDVVAAASNAFASIKSTQQVSSQQNGNNPTKSTNFMFDSVRAASSNAQTFAQAKASIAGATKTIAQAKALEQGLQQAGVSLTPRPVPGNSQKKDDMIAGTSNELADIESTQKASLDNENNVSTDFLRLGNGR